MPVTADKLFGSLLIACRGKNPELPDAPIVNDSRQITPGAVFAAIPGTANDGEKFIADAIAAGAAAVIHHSDLADYPPEILFCQVTDVRKAFSLLCRHRCNTPDEALQLYGVTGTNGKTTSVYLMRHLLNAAGCPCGLVSTVEYDDGAHTLSPTHTTPDPQTLFPLLAAMRANQLAAAAMEFSSHALAQNRLHGITLKGAVFTNLTGDHLDYHRDMENYYQAKKTLFTDLIVPGGIAAINIDSPAGLRLAAELADERPDLKIPTFGKAESAGWRISESAVSVDGCSFVLSNALQAYQVNFPLPGDYNISNLAGVLTLMLCSGIAPAAIDRALSMPLQVPGRLEKLSAPNGANFFVDYAHTDDALANVLSTLKKLCSGKLIAVFGAGGNRDKSKRPRMGAAAAAIADKLIITSDNPRSEEPLDIIADILSGIPENCDFEVAVSRENALKLAVDTAQKNDIVLVAGKGHENYQEIKGVKHHFDDREILRRLLEESHE
ncbi:MAG: UDP-N-acetylmuramoyl-L-alanyl-D-glutamate--2,6-diaminopimelate ligase [Lentisphaerae bacterium]|nr:UDP-N-acetylmuramoyl-L-alanyl-D-glutamate--2,6-diaminopimelate ligase [Lentisphaerota bacterium]